MNLPMNAWTDAGYAQPRGLPLTALSLYSMSFASDHPLKNTLLVRPLKGNGYCEVQLLTNASEDASDLLAFVAYEDSNTQFRVLTSFKSEQPYWIAGVYGNTKGDFDALDLVSDGKCVRTTGIAWSRIDGDERDSTPERTLRNTQLNVYRKNDVLQYGLDLSLIETFINGQTANDRSMLATLYRANLSNSRSDKDGDWSTFERIVSEILTNVPPVLTTSTAQLKTMSKNLVLQPGPLKSVDLSACKKKPVGNEGTSSPTKTPSVPSNPALISGGSTPTDPQGPTKNDSGITIPDTTKTSVSEPIASGSPLVSDPGVTNGGGSIVKTMPDPVVTPPPKTTPPAPSNVPSTGNGGGSDCVEAKCEEQTINMPFGDKVFSFDGKCITIKDCTTGKVEYATTVTPQPCDGPISTSKCEDIVERLPGGLFRFTIVGKPEEMTYLGPTLDVSPCEKTVAVVENGKVVGNASIVTNPDGSQYITTGQKQDLLSTASSGKAGASDMTVKAPKTDVLQFMAAPRAPSGVAAWAWFDRRNDSDGTTTYFALRPGYKYRIEVRTSAGQKNPTLARDFSSWVTIPATVPRGSEVRLLIAEEGSEFFTVVKTDNI